MPGYYCVLALIFSIFTISLRYILMRGDENAVGGPVVITHLCDAHWQQHTHTHAPRYLDAW